MALEKLVEGSFELPGYTTLDEMAATIREEVNSAIFALVVERIGPAGVAGLDRMLCHSGRSGRQERLQPVEADRAAAVVDPGRLNREVKARVPHRATLRALS